MQKINCAACGHEFEISYEGANCPNCGQFHSWYEGFVMGDGDDTPDIAVMITSDELQDLLKRRKDKE